jgi:hypothetical protein
MLIKVEAIRRLMRPCPCCGSKEYTISEYDCGDQSPPADEFDYDYMIGCQSCGLHTDYGQLHIVLGVWNTRVES